MRSVPASEAMRKAKELQLTISFEVCPERKK
jgi:hypothetical protein